MPGDDIVLWSFDCTLFDELATLVAPVLLELDVCVPVAEFAILEEPVADNPEDCDAEFEETILAADCVGVVEVFRVDIPAVCPPSVAVLALSEAADMKEACIDAIDDSWSGDIDGGGWAGIWVTDWKTDPIDPIFPTLLVGV